MGARASFFLTSLGLSIALAVWLVTREPVTYGALATALVAAAACGVRERGRLGGWLVALGVLNLLTLAPELGLRAAGFRHVSGVQFGYPTPEEFWELVPDERLFWRLPPASGPRAPGVGPPVNSLGFLGPEPLEPVPAGAVRLVVLGDSCSQQGWPESYPDLLAAELSARGVAVDLVNLSMSGYSTHQGRVLAETELPELAPQLVLVWYGWNDHWQAYGAPDSGKRGSLRRERLYRASRLLQGLRRLSGRAGLGAGAPRLELTRVPLDDYRANLTAIVRAARAAGAEAVLVTAPTSHRRLGVPAYLVDEGFAPSAEAVVERHLEYAQVTREVAAAEGAPLADLDAELERATDLARAFVADGIHLSVSGRRAVALLLADFLEERALVARRP